VVTPRKSSANLAMITVNSRKIGGGDVAVAITVESKEHLEQLCLVCVESTSVLATASSSNSTLLPVSTW
jgi:hypothetical protein